MPEVAYHCVRISRSNILELVDSFLGYAFAFALEHAECAVQWSCVRRDPRWEVVGPGGAGQFAAFAEVGFAHRM